MKTSSPENSSFINQRFFQKNVLAHCSSSEHLQSVVIRLITTSNVNFQHVTASYEHGSSLLFRDCNRGDSKVRSKSNFTEIISVKLLHRPIVFQIGTSIELIKKRLIKPSFDFKHCTLLGKQVAYLDGRPSRDGQALQICIKNMIHTLWFPVHTSSIISSCKLSPYSLVRFTSQVHSPAGQRISVLRPTTLFIKSTYKRYVVAFC